MSKTSEHMLFRGYNIPNAVHLEELVLKICRYVFLMSFITFFSLLIDFTLLHPWVIL